MNFRKNEPLTDEDRAAWFDWQVNRKRDWSLWAALEKSFESDRRDADRMLEAQCARWCELSLLTGLVFVSHPPYMGPMDHNGPIGGVLDELANWKTVSVRLADGSVVRQPS